MGVSDGLKKAWYRTFQEGLNIGARALYWRKPETVTGEGCAAQIPAIMKKEGHGRHRAARRKEHCPRHNRKP